MICHLVCVYLGSIQDGFTPLSVAAQNGHWRVVRLLIAAKVDVNTPANVSYNNSVCVHTD